MFYNDEITYQEFEIGDETGILTLFQTVFLESMKKIWNYYYEGSFISPINHNHHVITTAKDAGKIVGTACIVASTINYYGTLIKGGIVKDVMVHPDYQRRGIFTRVSKKNIEIARSYGYEFLFSLPNKNSYPAFNKYLNWQTVTPVNIFEYQLNKAPYEKVSYNVFQATENYDLPDLSMAISNIQTLRDKNYFKRRYSEHWNRDKYFFLINNNGLIVLKKYTVDIAHIMDIIPIKGIQELLNSAIHFLSIKGCSLLNTFSPFFENDLLDFGFREKKGSTYFIVKSLTDRPIEQYKNIKSYYVSLGDSDVY